MANGRRGRKKLKEGKKDPRAKQKGHAPTTAGGGGIEKSEKKKGGESLKGRKTVGPEGKKREGQAV